jgi:hypothetical protein
MLLSTFWYYVLRVDGLFLVEICCNKVCHTCAYKKHTKFLLAIYCKVKVTFPRYKPKRLRGVPGG